MKFLRFRRITAGTTDAAIFGTRAAAGNGTRNGFFSNVSVDQGTITVGTAPTPGTHRVEIEDADAVTKGTQVILSGSDTSVRTTIGATLNALDDTSAATIDTTSFNLERADSGGPPSQALQFAFDYEVASPDEDLCLVALGDKSQAFTTTLTPAYQSFDNNGADTSTTESEHQVPFPATGTFGPILIFWSLTPVGGDSEVALRINGADVVGTVTTLLGQASSTHQVTVLEVTVPVVAGDLVNLRITRTGASNGSLNLWVVMGFKA